MTAILSFWEKLLHRVHVCGDMTMLEAHRRDNLYGFLIYGTNAKDAEREALACPESELPPVIFIRVPNPSAEWEWRCLADKVELGELSAYEAANQYYLAMKSEAAND